MIDTVLDEKGIELVRGSLPVGRRKCSDFAEIINAVRKVENKQQRQYTAKTDELEVQLKLVNELQLQVATLKAALLAKEVAEIVSATDLNDQDKARLLSAANVA